MGKTVANSLSFAHVQGEYWLELEAAQETAWTETIASKFDSDQPQEEYPWLGQSPKMVPWTGERPTQVLTSDGLVVVNDDFTTNITISLKDWRRDKTGQLRKRTGEMADATVEHSMDLLSDLIKANGTAYDGVAFYAGTHNVGGFTIDNDVVAGDGLAGGSDPTTAQQSKNIQLMLQRALSFKGDEGRAINRRAKVWTIMVPTNLMGATFGAIANDFVGNGESNTLKAVVSGTGQFKGITFNVIVNTDLDDTPNQMHMFRSDARIMPFIYQEELVEIGGLPETSEWAHLNKAVRFDADISCAAAYGRFELAVRGTLS